MRRLNRVVQGDEGAIATIVAILLGFGVLTGVLGITVDVGHLYAERRELQNGADAAALAVAQECAAGVNCTTAAATTTSTNIASQNASDNAAGVNLVCGVSFPGLSACPASSGAWADCPTTSMPSYSVQVRTRTRTPGGSTLLPPFFARALVGNGAYQGTTVIACARARKLNAGHGTGLAMTVSKCEWNRATSNGTVFASPPPYPQNAVPGPGAEVRLAFHIPGGSAVPCTPPISGPSGWDLPGGFGSLNDPNGNCTTTVDAGGTYNDNTGANLPGPCQTVLNNAIANRTILYMPVYDGNGGTGHNGQYHLAGFAAFVPTGYFYSNAAANKSKSWLTNSFCNTTFPNGTKCISGYFTQGLIPGGTEGGSPGLPGVSTISLIG